MIEPVTTRRGLLKGIAAGAALGTFPSHEPDKIKEAYDNRFHENVGGLAIGTGDSIPSVEDIELDNEIYRSHIGNFNVDNYQFRRTGQINVYITGGKEVPADVSISELGVLDREGELLTRKLIPAIIPMAGRKYELHQPYHLHVR